MPRKRLVATGATMATAGQQAMNDEHAFKRRDWNPDWLERLREICMAYPEVVEVEQFGGPWWKAGKKSFCEYGAESVKDAKGYHGVDGACFKLSLMEQQQLVQDPRFEKARYIGQHGWTTMRFGSKVDWKLVAELVDDAYREVANARMLKALEARESGPRGLDTRFTR